jgi:hypothetical protein
LEYYRITQFEAFESKYTCKQNGVNIPPINKTPRWGVGINPLHGSERQGFGDPGVCGAEELVNLAEAAARENLKNPIFWNQVVERARVLRDVMSVQDLAFFVDLLVRGVEI